MMLLVTAASATWQIPDTLIYEGKEYSIFDDLLTPYFKKYPDRDPKDEDYNCSASWRGYRAVFEIKRGELVLKDIFTKPCSDSSPSALLTVIPDGKPLKIDWYSGIFVTLDGKNNEAPYSLEFLTGFDRYSFFEIENGKFSTAKHFDNKGFHAFKKEQFEKYKKTAEFSNRIKEITDRGKTSAEDAEKSLEVWHVFSLKKFL